MGQLFSKNVVVMNRPGGRGGIAYASVGRAAADGYTLLLASNGFVIGKLMDPALPYEPLDEFTSVALLATADMAFFLSRETPARSVADIVRYARANPGKLTYISPSTGTPQHLAMELFKLESGINLLHVPFRDYSAAVVAIVSGEANAVISPYFGPLSQHAKAGEIRAIAVLSSQRVKDMPTVPTLKESGYPNVDVHVWYGVLGPRALPTEVITRLNVNINTALVSANVGDAFGKQGLRLVGGTPHAFEEWVLAENAKWTRVVKEAGIKPE